MTQNNTLLILKKIVWWLNYNTTCRDGIKWHAIESEENRVISSQEIPTSGGWPITLTVGTAQNDTLLSLKKFVSFRVNKYLLLVIGL